MDIFEIRRQLSMGKSIYDLPLRVTYYARVSTDKDEQIHSYKNQIAHYEEKIKSVPLWTFVDGYMDEGITGTSINKRDDFNRMTEDAAEDKFDLILTKDICRFARNTVDTLVTTRELLRVGVGVFFELDNVNTLSSEGELRLTIMASLAQDESRKISERVKFGFEKSVKKGVVLGNNKIWGYKKDNGKLVIAPEEAKIVKRIFELYSNNDIGIRNIGHALGKEGFYTKSGKEFAFSTIKSIITNPKYKGYYVGGKTTTIDFISKQRKYFTEDEWTYYKDQNGYVPAIVDEELWERCNQLYKSRGDKVKNKETSYNTKYKYSGKLFCKNDGQAFWRTAVGKKEAWQCSQYKKNGLNGCKNNTTVYTHELDYILKNLFVTLFKDKDMYVEELVEMCKKYMNEKKDDSEVKELERQIDNARKEKKNLIKLFTLEKIDEKEFEEMNSEYIETINGLQNRLEELLSESEAELNIDQKIKQLKKYFKKTVDFEDELPEEIIDSMIERIEIEKYGRDNSKRYKTIKLHIYLKIGLEIPAYIKNRFCLLLTTHMIRADIETEVSPIVGSEKQSEELVNYLLSEFESDPIKIWESNIFGKNLHELVNEGLQNKLYRMPEDAQGKLQETLERIVNEGSGGLICIIL